MFEQKEVTFTSFSGKRISAYVREGTADFNAINASLVEDEYQLKEYHFEDGDVVIDIGSATGGEALAISAVNPNVKIYCYEPLPENADILEKNIQNNGFFNVKVFPQAVSDKNGTVKMNYGNLDSESGRHHYFIGNALNIPQGEHVNVVGVTLEKIFEQNDIKKCKMIKLDPEGVEYEILKACPVEILERVDWIIGEHHRISRGEMLKSVKGLFDDIPCLHQSEKNLGHFRFKNKRLK